MGRRTGSIGGGCRGFCERWVGIRAGFDASESPPTFVQNDHMIFLIVYEGVFRQGKGEQWQSYERVSEQEPTMTRIASSPTVLGFHPGPESCESCGASGLRTELVRDPFIYGSGEGAVELIADLPVHSCPQCGASYRGEEAETLQHEAVCRHLGVLTPAEIRALRRRHDMSRAAFSRLTGFGEATLARWERGEVIQNTSSDSFLRLLMSETVLRRLSSLTQYEDKLGREFSMVFHSLENDWASALMRYQEFPELFGTTERVKLLNAIGGGLFWDVQQMFWSDLMLRLTRLTDPPKSAGKANLTVQRLPRLCEAPDLREEVEDLVRTAVDATAFARDWRNRRIGHSDLARAIDPSPEPLMEATLKKSKTALDAVHAVLDSISRRLLHSDIENEVHIRPRARAFIAYASQLIEAVQYVDSTIDPSGEKPITDQAAAEAFLRKLHRRPTWRNKRQVFELREAARRFPIKG